MEVLLFNGTFLSLQSIAYCVTQTYFVKCEVGRTNNLNILEKISCSKCLLQVVKMDISAKTD